MIIRAIAIIFVFTLSTGGSNAIVMEEKKAEVVLETPEQIFPVISEEINPTGIFAINGEYYLMFKEKRLKAGDTIYVSHGEREYEVSLDRVSSKDYTISFRGITIQQKLK